VVVVASVGGAGVIARKKVGLVDMERVATGNKLDFLNGKRDKVKREHE
jgi:hypothetical protein